MDSASGVTVVICSRQECQEPSHPPEFSPDSYIDSVTNPCWQMSRIPDINWSMPVRDEQPPTLQKLGLAVVKLRAGRHDVCLCHIFEGQGTPSQSLPITKVLCAV